MTNIIFYNIYRDDSSASSSRNEQISETSEEEDRRVANVETPSLYSAVSKAFLACAGPPIDPNDDNSSITSDLPEEIHGQITEMAVQVLVAPFLKVIYGHLNSLIQDEFSLLYGVRKDLQELSQTLSTISAVLEDAEEKQINDKPTRNWLRKLKDAAYEADDILDECTMVSGFLYIKQIMFRHKMWKKIKEIGQKFDKIAAERSQFHLTSGVAVSGGEELVRPDRETSSDLIEPIVYGRDED